MSQYVIHKFIFQCMRSSHFTMSSCFVSLQTQDAKRAVVAKSACHAENVSQVPDSLWGVCYRGHRARDSQEPQYRDRILKSLNQAPVINMTILITVYPRFIPSKLIHPVTTIKTVLTSEAYFCFVPSWHASSHFVCNVNLKHCICFL